MSEQTSDHDQTVDPDVVPFTGTADADADAEAAGAEPGFADREYIVPTADLDDTEAHRDDDGEQVGQADALADAEEAGAEPDAR